MKIFSLISAFLVMMAFGNPGVVKEEITPAKNSDLPIIVRLAEDSEPQAALAAWKEANKVPQSFRYVRQVSKRLNLHLFTIAEGQGDPAGVIHLLKGEKHVLTAYQPSRLESRYREPNDPFYANQWPLEKIQAPLVWDLTTGGTAANGAEVVIALMDYGFEYTHPDLADNLWTNPGEVPSDGQDNDGNGYIDDYLGLNVKTGDDQHPSDFHGTGAAGLIGAKGDNTLGISGVNWNTSIMLFSPMEYTYHVTEALEYCLDMREKYNQSGGTEGAFIVATSLSLGVPSAFPNDSQEMMMWCELYEEAGAMGILNAVAAPNANVDIGLDGDMPGLCPSASILAVTNTDLSDRKVVDAGYSSQHIDLGAPGDESYSTYLGSSYREFGGCSASTPHVAGAIGLLYSLPFTDFMDITEADPARGAQLVRSAILEGVQPLNSLDGVTTSGGRLDLYMAMQKLREAVIMNQLGEKELEFVSLTPNPADDQLRVVYKSRTLLPIDMTMYNIQGQEIRNTTITPGFGAESEVILPVDDLAPGVYFIQFRNRAAEIKQTIIVQ